MKTAEVSMFIIEDDAYFRETFIDVMGLRGIEVQGAGSAVEGLRMLETARPSIIILDIQLPDLDGFQICRRIKHMEAFKDTPVIFISASSRYAEAQDRVEMFLAGASAFLPKPITMDRLWAEIEALLERGGRS